MKKSGKTVNADHYKVGKAMLVWAKGGLNRGDSDWIIDSAKEALKSPLEVEAVGRLMPAGPVITSSDVLCALALVRALA